MNIPHNPQASGAALPRGIIFDMDGVLFESGPYHRDSWFRLAEEEGIPGVTDQWFRDTFGMTGDDMICDLFGRRVDPKEINRLMDRKEWHYRESARGHVVFPRGLRALLDGLVRRGWSIAIGSAGPRENVELIVEELGIRPILAATVSSNDVTHGKPDPEVFLLAASRMGISPARCVVVEDATVGVQAARAAGMKCLGITTTHPREKLALYTDRIIDSFEEISAEEIEGLLGNGDSPQRHRGTKECHGGES